ncbi:MAG: DUF3459 domain-containing protein, partial [Variovorax sp.]|nr:DUF3459 domain-containing protein [Variovorax sp.]
PNAGFSSGTPWLPVDGAHLPLAVAQQEADPDSMLAFSRALLHWRRTQPLLRTGALAFVDAPEPLLHIVRSEGGAVLHAIFNTGSEPVSIPLPELLVPLTGHPLASTATVTTEPSSKPLLTLAPYGVCFGTPAAAGGR